MNMREMIDLVDHSELPSITAVEALRTELAAAAQKPYDEWEQDEDGYDETHGGGGICHVIADEVSWVLSRHNIETYTVSATHEVHVYLVGAFQEGVYEIDVPHRLYERGGGYTWTKIPGVTFAPDDIAISRIDRDPMNIAMYAEEI